MRIRAEKGTSTEQALNLGKLWAESISFPNLIYVYRVGELVPTYYLTDEKKPLFSWLTGYVRCVGVLCGSKGEKHA
jgi:hypothetical protein